MAQSSRRSTSISSPPSRRRRLLSPAESIRIKRRFSAYVDAIANGKFSEAIGPRNDLLASRILVLFPRKGVRS